jgi:excisionase family DNA binding protein
MSSDFANNQFLTPPAVGRLLGCGSDKVLNLIRTGELRASNLAGGSQRPRWKINPADLQAFLERRSNSALSKPAAPQSTRRRIPQASEKFV